MRAQAISLAVLASTCSNARAWEKCGWKLPELMNWGADVKACKSCQCPSDLSSCALAAQCGGDPKFDGFVDCGGCFCSTEYHYGASSMYDAGAGGWCKAAAHGPVGCIECAKDVGQGLEAREASMRAEESMPADQAEAMVIGETNAFAGLWAPSPSQAPPSSRLLGRAGCVAALAAVAAVAAFVVAQANRLASARASSCAAGSPRLLPRAFEELAPAPSAAEDSC